MPVCADLEHTDALVLCGHCNQVIVVIGNFQRCEMRLLLCGRREFDPFAWTFLVLNFGFRLLHLSAATPTYPQQANTAMSLRLMPKDRHHLPSSDAQSPTMLMWLRSKTAPQAASQPRQTAPTHWHPPTFDHTRQDTDMGASWCCRVPSGTSGPHAEKFNAGAGPTQSTLAPRLCARTAHSSPTSETSFQRLVASINNRNHA
jgi:hypothetical protein